MTDNLRYRGTKTKISTSQERSQSPPVSPKIRLFTVIIKGLALFIIVNLSLSYFITENFTWGYSNKYTNINRHIQFFKSPVELSEAELARFDGSDPSRPIYLAMDGEVYDVSSSRATYGPGGSYHFFSGKDAARAFVTGCFKPDHLIHDLRGLNEIELKDLEGWKRFYADHGKYFRVGKVYHEPLDPNSEFPPPCNGAKKP
ncbi:Membrane steroid-binding protein 1 [Neolecta irregularis DAH-3]|uniref:Membrane steroid-binding protein 1 n=1 Tax=Neolecta irregularis (strain DAH-3) TaxID=1198029 RepID=A0A1U7LIN3_NEOID|nr:Membrane steroid-binding protein 1 [Neolecta irregularis DAH-3]|eukprot:OLL22515.1 Membrane steroid-binding protein 1 [Neolecta irregularis DAH-3]